MRPLLCGTRPPYRLWSLGLDGRACPNGRTHRWPLRLGAALSDGTSLAAKSLGFHLPLDALLATTFTDLLQAPL